MTRPIDIEMYIGLSVEGELDQETKKKWYRCVVDNAPHGVVTTVQVEGDGLRQVSMVARTYKGETLHMIPLTRSLAEAEVDAIREAFEEVHDGDYAIEASITYVYGATEGPSIQVEKEDYEKMCREWAKRRHNEWVNRRLSQGWRYGVNGSVAEKTNPLLRQWDDLPEAAKHVDTQAPKDMLKLLSDYGFSIVTKSDLEAVQQILRSKL